MLKYLDKKQLFAKDTKTTPTDVKGSMIKDMETLNAIYWSDMEKLGFLDKEALGQFMDNEKLGLVYTDMEVLSALPFFDAEKLGTGFTDVERLGGQPLFFDTEKLGVFFDSEKLGFWDNEKLGRIPAF